MSDPLSDLSAAMAAENLLAVSQAARALVAESPALAGRWSEVAAAALTAGDELTALAAARKLTQSAPDHAASWLWVASVHMALDQPGEALGVMEAAARRLPREGAIHRRMGRALAELNQRERAQTCFRTALSLDHNDALAWEGLAQAKTFSRGDDDLAAMEQVRIGWNEQTPARTRGVLSYAIAKAYEDTGEYEAAGRRVAEGAAFFRETAPFDVDGHEAGVAHVLKVYDSRFAEVNEEAGVLDARPVMIFAPPRAGASWLSRVLSAPDGAAGLGRRNALFWASSSPLGDHRPEDLLRAFQEGGANILSRVGRTYLDRLGEQAGREAKRVVDPSSLLEIAGGAAGLCLPAAKFVRITRTPRDAAWSIYKHRFAQGRHWSYHPDDIARVLAAHNRLCERWEALFGERMMTVAYEDLAADPKGEAARIAAFAGVGADAAGVEAWLTAERLQADPVGVHERGGSRFEAVDAALQRAGLI